MSEENPSNQESRNFELLRGTKSLKGKAPDLERQIPEDLPSDASELEDHTFGPQSSAELVAIAAEELQRRRLRAGHIPDNLLGEPAWMILLHAFISHHRGVTASIQGLCRTAELPQGTTMRWIRALQDSELLRRSSGGAGAKITRVVLTPEGYKRVRAILEKFAQLRSGC